MRRALKLVSQGAIVIRIDLHCHLEVTFTKQDHFGIKLTVAQKR